MLSRLRVAVLFSHRAHGMAELLARDPHRGVLYDVVAAVSSEDPFPGRRAAWEAHGIPFLSHPIRRFHRWLGQPLSDTDAREAYDETVAMALDPFRPDLLLLAGYLYVVTAPMLERYASRIVNVHHADLTRVGANGAPLFPGLRAVREAIRAGERETRATAHVATAAVDRGPLLARSWAFPVSPLAAHARETGAEEVLKAYAFAHQEWMLATAWAPLLAFALERFATGRVAVVGGRALLDGRPGPEDVRPWPPSSPLAIEPATLAEALA